MDYSQLRYSIFYFPGSGGSIVNWLFGLIHDPSLLDLALESFPTHLKHTPSTIRNDNGPTEGWLYHESSHCVNPYARSVAIYLHTPKITVSSIVSLSSTLNILVDTNSRARLRMCYEKKVMPFASGVILKKATVRRELEVYRLGLDELKTNRHIHFCFKYATIFNNTYIDELERITAKRLSTKSRLAVQTLVDRYVHINPEKTLRHLL